MNRTTAYIRTEDIAFSGNLNDLDIPGVEVLMRFTGAVPTCEIFEHVINFASDAAVAAFAVWLAERIKKKRPSKSRMNGKQIPSEVTKITVEILLGGEDNESGT